MDSGLFIFYYHAYLSFNYNNNKKKKLTLADHLEESIESRPVQQFIFVRMEPNPEMTTAGEYRSFKGAPAKIPK